MSETSTPRGQAAVARAFEAVFLAGFHAVAWLIQELRGVRRRRIPLIVSITGAVLLACDDSLSTPGDSGRISSVRFVPDDTDSLSLSSVGDSLRLDVEVRDARGELLESAVPSWRSSAPEVATVDGDGLLVARSAGRTEIIAVAGDIGDTMTVGVQPHAPTAEPPAGPPAPDPAVGDDSSAVLLAAGDIAKCNSVNRAEATARILDSLDGTIATLGDNAYSDGTGPEFANCYEPTWGRHRERTRPTPGNHEYNVSPEPYFDYFNGEGSDTGAAGKRGQGYYSYDLGTWHIVVLNTGLLQKESLPDGAESPQLAWLRADLAAHPARCTLAYWHHPYFTSGAHPPFKPVRPFLELLYQAGAEIVLSGHSHQYERFAPQTLDRTPDSAHGIQAFVVGTGGAGVYGFRGDPAPNSVVREGAAHGVLKLSLAPTGYRWEFIPTEESSFRDAGSGQCH